MRTYIFVFSHRHLPFRWPEFLSVLGLLDRDEPVQVVWLSQDCPFAVLRLRSDDVVQHLLSRCVLIRSAVEHWASGDSYPQLQSRMRTDEFHQAHSPYFQESVSWCMRVHAYGKTIDKDYIVNRIESFDFLPLAGPVNLREPAETFFVFENWGSDCNNVPQQPLQVHFGRFIGCGQSTLPDKMSLSRRCYIGNTSMDPILSLIVANLAQIVQSQLVLDPFVGTGSLLVAAAHFGGYVLGMDIMYDVVHAMGKSSRKDVKFRSPDESIRANLEQYGLGSLYLDVIVGDSSKVGMWRSSGASGMLGDEETRPLFDAVISDPPYGLRERTVRIGSNKLDPTVPAECLDRHYPSKVKYHVSSVYLDLLDFAADYLQVGGRLVYWYPVYYAQVEKLTLAGSAAIASTKIGDECMENGRLDDHDESGKCGPDARCGRSSRKKQKNKRRNKIVESKTYCIDKSRNVDPCDSMEECGDLAGDGISDSNNSNLNVVSPRRSNDEVNGSISYSDDFLTGFPDAVDPRYRSILPEHPWLVCRYCCDQQLQLERGRLLVVMEKVKGGMGLGVPDAGDNANRASVKHDIYADKTFRDNVEELAGIRKGVAGLAGDI